MEVVVFPFSFFSLPFPVFPLLFNVVGAGRRSAKIVKGVGPGEKPRRNQQKKTKERRRW